MPGRKPLIYPFLLFWLSTNLILSSLNAQALPTQTSNLFSGSGNCATCHAPGLPNTNALLGPNGEDISPVTFWRSTMMGNAAKDPLFQAKVSAEVSEHPLLQSVIEDKCTTCHAPLGRTEAIFNGATHYSLSEMQIDPLAMDGVSCTACHQIKDVNLGSGSSFSGHYTIENDRLIYGPYANPVAGPMQMMVNYTPVYSGHLETSELCATCHTLFTPTVDDNGQIVGEFPEQTAYLEWKNSIFPAQDTQCQTCHMPALDFPVTISNRPIWLGTQNPFYYHYFVGGNVYMLQLLKNHGSEIGVTATAEQFDSTIARSRRLLQQETVALSANYQWKNAGELEIKVALKNKSGHKLPTGFPSRRAWIYLSLEDQGGQPLFSSGAFNPQNGEIMGEDSLYEPHHDFIDSPEQVQIYQSVMEDVYGEVTYILLHGAEYRKDNRLPPQGFSSQGLHYDTTAIKGMAAQDPNFNRDGSVEGTATDTTTYNVGNLNWGQAYQLTVKIYYQTLSPRFAENLFEYNTPEVQTFQNYYNQENNSPVTLDSLQLAVLPATGIHSADIAVPDSPFLLSAYPNPFNPQLTMQIEVAEPGELRLEIYNLLGQLVKTFANERLEPGPYRFTWNTQNAENLTVTSGEYFIKAQFSGNSGKPPYTLYRKVILMK